MNKNTELKVLLVDPSLFTAPYDAALTKGLIAAGVNPRWATRPLRPGEQQEITAEYVDDFFYRLVENVQFLPKILRGIAKGISHLFGLLKLAAIVISQKPDIVHFQWIVIPLLDAMTIRLLRLYRPVILTVHDTTPFNGEHISFLQNAGFDLPIRFADKIIVHTQSALRTLTARGIPVEKIQVIPHGPLRLNTPIPELSLESRDARWTFVLFGEIKPYKGFDLLVEAISKIPEETRLKARFVVAGRPRMDIDPILERIEELNLSSIIDVRPVRLSELEMAELFAQTDCFVFPYRQIDASGVYFLVKGLGKWLIASRVGIFAEDMQNKTEGALVTSSDVSALADEIRYAIETRPIPVPSDQADSWESIGQATRSLYAQAIVKT